MGVLMSMRRVRNRVYGDFVMPSRLAEYGQLLERALGSGYQICSVGGLWRQVLAGGLVPSQRYMVLRHDVDTDPETAEAMWDIDRGLGVETSYFFRLSTLAPALMADIAAGGGEASYHYEEFSFVAKRRRLRSRPEALAALPEARYAFAANIERLRARTGLPMRVVAAHGDFVNRRLGVPNSIVLADAAFRTQVGVDLEAYDEPYLRHLTKRHSDAPPPQLWEGKDPALMIEARVPVIAVLIHPRYWRANRVANTRDDVRRLLEGVRYSLPGAF